MGFAVILSTIHQIVFSLMHSRKCFFLLIYSCSQNKKKQTKKTIVKKEHYHFVIYSQGEVNFIASIKMYLQNQM